MNENRDNLKTNNKIQGSNDYFTKAKYILQQLIDKDQHTKENLLSSFTNIIELIDKQQDKFNNITASLSDANVQSAELIAEVEEKNNELEKINNELSKSNAYAAELMAEIEIKNERIQCLNKSLSTANAEGAELIVKVESQKDELQKAHEELNLLNKNLEKKVQERTAEIRHLLNEKDDFINELAHDLRTPLTPLINLIPFLRKNERDEERKKAFDIIIKNVNNIHGLVKKTVRIAVLNAPSFHLKKETKNLSDTINNIIKNLEYDQSKYMIINKIDDGLETILDIELFSELMIHLIDNALKFSPKGGNIIINATTKGEHIQVSINDNGIGLSNDELNCIFDDFYKADWSRHDLGSNGLGLTICEKIVQKHEGEIWAESPGYGKGSTFHFTLRSILQDENVNYYEKVVDQIDKKLT